MFVGKNGDPLVFVFVVDAIVVDVVDDVDGGGGTGGNDGEENGFTSHGSIGNVEETGGDDDEAAAAVERDVLGKLDIGKSGFIFNELASAFSCRRHLARRF